MSPMVAPTTAPNEPSGLGAGVEGAEVVEDRAGHRAPSSVRARWTSGASLLEVSASTKSPASCLRAVSTNGSSEPKPRNGLTVIASAASGLAGSR